jgi:cell division ATPase FtsA
MNKEEIIGKEFALDLGSTPVQVVVKNITKDKVIVEYLNSTSGRMEEFTISDFEYLAMVKIQ